MENMQRWSRSKHLKYHVTVIYCMRSQWTAHAHLSVHSDSYASLPHAHQEQHQCGWTHGNINTTDSCVSQQGIMGDETT